MLILSEFFQERSKYTRKLVEAVITAEQNYIFTNDADYKQNRTQIVTMNNHNQQPSDNAQEVSLEEETWTDQAVNSSYVKEIKARVG